ncbi:MAG TPA: hypothetical protein VK869_14875 [Rubrobacteraceae bacterium]|nr:hypothetical protein [Rubrobacteraceae bacterium]
MTAREPTARAVERPPRDADHWARYVETLEVSDVPEGAVNLNVEGRRVVGPLQGFGKMWQKTYRVRLEGVDTSSAEVVRVWKERFPEFWAPGNRFFVPSVGLSPGGVALINGDMPGSRWFSTGIMVLYADEDSFTYITPEGHPFSGWITFSAHNEDDGPLVAQAQLLIRANDPLYELLMPLGIHRLENTTWQRTLENLAAHFGASGEVETRVVCVDPKRRWSRYGNIRHNAIILSALHAVARRLRRLRARPAR